MAKPGTLPLAQVMPWCSQTRDWCNSRCSCCGQSVCKRKRFLTSTHCALPRTLPGSCAGCILAATRLPIGTNASHLSQSLSKWCMALCDLSHAAPIENSNTWLCRWERTGSFYTIWFSSLGTRVLSLGPALTPVSATLTALYAGWGETEDGKGKGPF